MSDELILILPMLPMLLYGLLTGTRGWLEERRAKAADPDRWEH